MKACSSTMYGSKYFKRFHSLSHSNVWTPTHSSNFILLHKPIHHNAAVPRHRSYVAGNQGDSKPFHFATADYGFSQGSSLSMRKKLTQGLRGRLRVTFGDNHNFRKLSVNGSNSRERRNSHPGGTRRLSRTVVAEIMDKSEKNEDLSGVYESDDNEDDNEDEIYDHIKVQKEVIGSVRLQPWTMSKKLKLLQLARKYVEKHEGRLSKSHEYHERGAQMFNILKRQYDNVISLLIPWEMRIKKVESHFGTVVASYFVFLRWLIWVNLWLALLPVCFVIIPELLVGAAHGSEPRKKVPKEDIDAAMDLNTIWNAEGIVEYSVIFYGYYGNEERIGYGYRLPLAYLLIGFAAFVFSFVVVLKKMASNFRLSRLSSKDEHFAFSWRLFSSWDYMIGNTETANTKVASIITTFREVILEEKEKQKSKEKYRLILQRIIANILVLMLLVISAYIIHLCVERTREMDLLKRRKHKTFDFWRENELTVVMTLISTIFPSLFDLISLMEQYHPRTNLRWQLARIFILNLLNLYTLFIALFWKQQDMKRDIKEQNSLSISCRNDSSFDGQTNIPTLTTSSDPNQHMSANCSSVTSINSTVNICWETMIGQEVLKLTIMDLVFEVGTILIQDILRAIFVRCCNVLCCRDLKKKPGYGDFKTAENILHLINNQGVIWLGTFFAPGLPVLNLLKLFVLMYIRSWTVTVFNVPQEGIFKSSRSNNFYYGLLLIMLFLSMLPPLFAIVSVEPSPDCGPFSGQQKMFHILTDTLDHELPPIATLVLDYVASPGVIIPVFLLFGMCIYYLVSVGKALEESNQELRQELQYERNEGKRKVYAMAEAKKNGDFEDQSSRRMRTEACSRMAVTSMTKVMASANIKKLNKLYRGKKQKTLIANMSVAELGDQQSLHETGRNINAACPPGRILEDPKLASRDVSSVFESSKTSFMREQTPVIFVRDKTPEALERDRTRVTIVKDHSLVKDQTPVALARDNTPAALIKDQTPVSLVVDKSPVAPISELTSVTLAREQTPVALLRDQTSVAVVRGTPILDRRLSDDTNRTLHIKPDILVDGINSDRSQQQVPYRSHNGFVVCGENKTRNTETKTNMPDVEGMPQEGSRCCAAMIQTHYEEVNETPKLHDNKMIAIPNGKPSLHQKKKTYRSSPNFQIPRSQGIPLKHAQVRFVKGSIKQNKKKDCIIPLSLLKAYSLGRQGAMENDGSNCVNLRELTNKRKPTLRSKAPDMRSIASRGRKYLAVKPEIRISKF